MAAPLLRDRLIFELETYFVDTEHADSKTISINDLNAFIVVINSKDYVQEAVSQCLKMNHESLWSFEKEFKHVTESSLKLYYMRIVFNSFMSILKSYTENNSKELEVLKDWFEEHRDNWSGPWRSRVVAIFNSENETVSQAGSQT